VSKAISKEHMREMFLDHCRYLARYWSAQERDPLRMCEGVAFSILTAIDGMAGDFPCAIDLVLRPHPDDKAHCEGEGEDYVEDDMVINDCMLHDLFYVKAVK
jgi:hypothetical protein